MTDRDPYLGELVRKVGVCFFIVCGIGPATGWAQTTERPMGLGLQLAEPGGITGKYWFESDEAVQATLGGRGHFGHGFGYDLGPTIAVDWTHRFMHLTPSTPVVRFGLHVGLGGAAGWFDANCYYDAYFNRRVCYDNSTLVLYGRLPVGFSAYFAKVHIEGYVEIIPALRLNDLTLVGFGGLGARYYF